MFNWRSFYKTCFPTVFWQTFRNSSECAEHCYRESSGWLIPDGFRTDIKVYNSASRSKVDLVLRKKNQLTWYSCGPTVYDSAHIGHACCYLKFDIIRRILQNVNNLNVVMVMGITDIDDKIINRALRENKDFKQISQVYENEFFDDIASLNILAPTFVTRVTDYIPDIIHFVNKILSKGLAYQTSDGSVYFDVSKYHNYGKVLCNIQKLETDDNPSSEKKSPEDFALWKGHKEGEPFWECPWGKGRPGWHIECSAMASKLLGSAIDFHTGGIDLLFPHHENEEAQSCAFHGSNQWVNYWLHAGHLNFKGNVKMSKSLKNTITVGDFLKEHSADHLRMYCLLSHYRKSIEFSPDSLSVAVGAISKIQNLISDCESYIKSSHFGGSIDEASLLQDVVTMEDAVKLSLSDDFDTSKAMGAILQFCSHLQSAIRKESSELEVRSPYSVALAIHSVRKFLDIFGLQFSTINQVKETTPFEKVFEASLDFRFNVRKVALNNQKSKSQECQELQKELLTLCDNYRSSLLMNGIDLKDHAKNTSWSVKAT